MKKIIGLLITGIFVISSAALAQESQAVFTYKVGAVEIILLSEGQRNGQSAILIGAAPEMLQQCMPDGTYPSATNAFLVRMPDKTVLIDAVTGSRLLANLQSLGVSPEQVNAVLITHTHGDHIGGLLRDGRAAFPNADIYLTQPEYDFWTKTNNESTQKTLEAYKNKLQFIQPAEIGANATPVLPGIKAVAAYGHTPGHAVYIVESNNEQLLIWGDLTHAMAIQMPYPQVAVTYDSNPEQAVVARKKVLEYISKNNIPVAGMHIAFPGIGKISKGAGEGYVFTPVSK